MGILSTDLVFLVSWFVFGGSIFSFVCLKSFFYGHVIVSKVINDPPEIDPQEERDFERGFNHHCDFISIQGVLIIHYR